MKGVARHIWISNSMRGGLLNEALAALARADVEAALMKGGALLARNPHLARVRLSGDYDVQIRLSDAQAAVAALNGAGFTSAMRLAFFSRFDFHEVHAVPFTKGLKEGNIDLHWWPLPRVRDQNFVEQLLARCEHANLFGRCILIPSLADHLFLCIVRPEPWDRDEVFMRAVEAALLLRECDGKLDWRLLRELVGKQRLGWIASRILQLIRDEADAPMDENIVETLWREAGPLKRTQYFLRTRSPRDRSRVGNVTLQAATIAQSEGHVSSLLLKRHLRLQLVRAVREQFRADSVIALDRIWEEEGAQDYELAPGELAFTRGFSVPELQGRWTDANLAVIQARVDAPPGTCVRVKLLLRPFISPGECSFAFTLAAGAGVNRHVLGAQGSGRHEILLYARVSAPWRKVVLVFRCPRPQSPQELGLARDPRSIGLFVEAIDFPDDPDWLWRFYAAQEIELSGAGPSYRLGFSEPEPGGRWTDATIAVLEIPVAQPVGTLATITCRVRPFFLPGSSSFTFEVNGGLGAKPYRVTPADGVTELALQARVLGKNVQKATLAFKLPEAARPHSFGLSPDPRMLGLWFEEINSDQPTAVASTPELLSE